MCRRASNNSYAHDEQGENPGQENESSTVSSIICDHRRSLISSVKVVSCSGVAEVKGMAGHWLVLHTAPVRAKPDGRRRLEGRATNTRQAVHFRLIPPPPYTSRHAFSHTPINSPLVSSWVRALDIHKVSVLRSRVGWTPARNNERTNKQTTPEFWTQHYSPATGGEYACPAHAVVECIHSLHCSGDVTFCLVHLSSLVLVRRQCR